jgi:hypothetical protein
MTNKFEAIYKITSPNGDSKLVSLGLCPGSVSLINPYTHPLIYFFMQNEPNFIPKVPTKQANGDDFTPNLFLKNYQLLLKSAQKSTHFSMLLLKSAQKNAQFSKTFIQNEPDLQNTQRRIMQNEPNFNYNFSHILTHIMRLLQIFTRRRRNFAQKMQKIRAFCKFLKITYLTQDITKAYMNFYHKLPFNRKEMTEIKK